MNYEIDRGNDTAGEPSIAEMTKKAIEILRKNPKGYFLFVEGNNEHHLLIYIFQNNSTALGWSDLQSVKTVSS